MGNANDMLWEAVRNNNIDNAKIAIRKGAYVDYIQDKLLDATPLCIAVSNGNVELVKLLVDNGADINIRSSFDGHTPLYWLPKKNPKEIIDLLIEEGADVDVKDYLGGKTPLFYALFHSIFSDKDYKKIAQALIDNGADINAEDINGNTILHACAGDKDSMDSIDFLLKNGANVNSKNYSGETPLHGALCSGGKEIARMLLDSGADIKIKNNEGLTPLDYLKYADNSTRKYIENIIYPNKEQELKKKKEEQIRKQREKEALKKGQEEIKRKEQEKLRFEEQDRLEKEQQEKQKRQEELRLYKRDFLDKISHGFALISQSNLSEALKLIRSLRAPEDEGEKIELLKLQSRIYNSQGLIEEEKQILQSLTSLISLDDESAEYYYSIATLYEETNELDKAASVYKQFIDLFMLDYKDINTRYKALKQKLSSPEFVQAKPTPPTKPITIIMDAFEEKTESFKERIDRLSSQGLYFSDTVYISKTTPIKIDTSIQISIQDIYEGILRTIKSREQNFNVSLSVQQVTNKYSDLEKQRQWIIIRSLKDIKRLGLGIDIVEALGKLTIDIYALVIPEEEKETEVSRYNNSIYQDIKMVQNSDSIVTTFIDAITDILNLSLKSIIEEREVKRF
jgi:ankyrin repeat protein